MTTRTRLAPEMSTWRIQRDVDELSEFRAQASAGWTRRAFSEEYERARPWLMNLMEDAGLEVRRDAANNLVGTLRGLGNGGALATGSHTDTVEGGGRFDGIAGVLAALEVVRTFRDAGIALHRELRVIDFFNEEPNDFGLSCIGSRALAGALSGSHLALVDSSGQNMGEALARIGGDPSEAIEIAWADGDVSAFLELHIEQGPVLEQESLPLAAVTSIAGIDRYRVDFAGQPDHAGATPMSVRHDALCAAAETALAVESAANATPGAGVGTTGRLDIEPGASNVVPGRATAWIEFRGARRDWLTECGRLLVTSAESAAERRGVTVGITSLSSVDAVSANQGVQSAIFAAIERLGLPYRQMFSGAGHDAAHMARIAPMGLIFIPSQGGRSHCAEEWTGFDQIAVGARALGQTLLQLDTMPAG